MVLLKATGFFVLQKRPVVRLTACLFSSKKRDVSPDSSGPSNGGGESPNPGKQGDASLAADSGGFTMVKNSIPNDFKRLICVPLQERPLFPKFYKNIIIEDKSVAGAIMESMKRGPAYIGLFLKKGPKAKSFTISNASDIHGIGVVASVTKNHQSPPDSNFIIYPQFRIKVDGPLEESSPVSIVKATRVHDEPVDKQSPLVRAITHEIFAVMADVAKLNPLFKHHLINYPVSSDILEEPGQLADFIATLYQGDPNEIQEVLDSVIIEERLKKALVLLKKVLINAQLQFSISQEIQQKVQADHEEMYLREQAKVISRILNKGEDPKSKILDEYNAKFKEAQMPDHAAKVFKEELSRIEITSGQEFSISKTYLDWLVQFPWAKQTEENLDIDHAISVLDGDHYGLKDVKDRILELIAIGKLYGSVQGKIICLHGPPGVGKTSIAKSIARALNRKFFRISVGGMEDVNELKGHRRTYVGAMPGKIIQGINRLSVRNPLILIDEVDKIVRGGHRGDPSAALLEILDPEQNSSFVDHYLDVPVDLSKVLFVCTANEEHAIHPALKDRMEFIKLSGYVHEEKVEIAKKYLVPEVRSECGIKEDLVTVDSSALDSLIKWYCRESGVRNLKKHIEKIFRKAALKIVQKGEEKILVTKENLKDYVGHPSSDYDKVFETTPPGVTLGLGFNAIYGGSVLPIETTVESKYRGSAKDSSSSSSSGSLRCTGQLQDVMKESSEIAYSFSKGFLLKSQPDNSFFARSNIHLHALAGAIPKDGPSAGCAMATALLSLALDKPVKQGLAMTGELSLTGKVLPIGGLKEKIMGAKRANVTDVICPKANYSDYSEMPDFIKSGINVHFVENYEEIYNLAFGY